MFIVPIVVGIDFVHYARGIKQKKNAIMLAVLMQAIREQEEQEFIFLTLTAPIVQGDDLKKEIDSIMLLINYLNVEM